MLKYLSLHIPLLEALENNGHARFMKELTMKKQTASFKDVGGVYPCSVVTSKSLD